MFTPLVTAVISASRFIIKSIAVYIHVINMERATFY